ncbi:MAG: hypothetical protein NTV70_12990 [Acidobacteria bacterium]|nr:hypothetical protein [Acidobacteriota bacterium]
MHFWSTLFLGTAVASAATPALLSLKVSDEVAPPGGVAQIRLIVTDPKPIVTGFASMDFGGDIFDGVRGIAVHSTDGSAYGVATYVNGKVTLDLRSIRGTLGSTLDYPIVTIAVAIRPDAPVGAVASVNAVLNPTAWRNLLGLPYAPEIKGGSVTVGGTASITNVVPGGGKILAGQPFSILGLGFDSKTTVKLNDAVKAATTFVNSERIDITPETSFKLDGTQIKLKTKAGEQVTYYSYFRGTRVETGGTSAAARAVPLFLGDTVRDALMIWGLPITPAQVPAIALQNQQTVPASVRIACVSGFGPEGPSVTVEIPAGGRAVYEVRSLFPGLVGLPAMRVTTLVGVKLLGLVGTESTGAVTSLPPFTIKVGL